MMANNMPQRMTGSWAAPSMTRDTAAPLAIARVVSQPGITQVYNTGDALKRGTLFPELDKPFLRYRGVIGG